MSTLSIVLIVKDEEENIVPCLESASFADELVVLDSGSSDRTVELARRYTELVFVAEDWQGYGIQRQRAQGYATGDWIFMLDADERITPELKEAMLQVRHEDRRDSVYQVARLSWCFGRFIRHSGWYPDHVTRLYPREQAAYDGAMVHEKLSHPPELIVRKLCGDLLHYTYRDLNHYLVKSAYYAQEWGQERHAQGRKAGLVQGVSHALACFIKMYLLRAGFLDGRQGLLLALLSAHSTFAKYADLWVRGHGRKEG